MRNKLPSIRVLAGLQDRGLAKSFDLLVYKFIETRRKFNQEIKIDSSKIYKQVRKACTKENIPVERTIVRAFYRLQEMGLLTIVYKLGFGTFVIKAISLDDFEDLYCRSVTAKSEPKKPKQRNTEKNQKTRVKQQQLIAIKQECQKVGINYRLEKDWWEIANHGADKVRKTIQLMIRQLSNPRTKIYNPCGWFKVALKDNYYLDDFDCDNSLALLERGYFHFRDKLLDLIGSLPQEIGALDEIAPTPT